MLTAYGTKKRYEISLNLLNNDHKGYMSNLWRKFTHSSGFRRKWKYNGGDVIFSI